MELLGALATVQVVGDPKVLEFWCFAHDRRRGTLRMS